MKLLVSSDDVTSDVLSAAETIYDGWFGPDVRMNWEEFWDRLCQGQDFDIEETDTAAMRKIQRHIRQYAKEGS